MFEYWNYLCKWYKDIKRSLSSASSGYTILEWLSSDQLVITLDSIFYKGYFIKQYMDDLNSK